MNQANDRGTQLMAQGGISGTLEALRERWWIFVYKRCLVGFPWFWPARPPGVPAMVAARRVIRRRFGDDHNPVYRALAQILTMVAWPAAVLLDLGRIRRIRGPEAVPIRRVPGALWAAIRHNILPGEYYAYALWQPDRKTNIDSYLYSHETARLFKLLNRPLQPNPIGDKLAFYETCKAHGLPTPEVLAEFAPNGTLRHFESHRPPEHDLFIKPRLGPAGFSAERFRWSGAIFESNRGPRIKPHDLDRYLVTRAQNEKQTLLVQPALSNHPDLQIEPNAALATARLVTGRTTAGDVFPIFGFIYFGRSGGIIAQHGPVALIDVASGRLVSTRMLGTGRSIYQLYNVLDNAEALPDWSVALQLAESAHQVCANFAFIGWDIAFTGLGPTLLEGNGNWTAEEYQTLSGQPLGHTVFADILRSRLREFYVRNGVESRASHF